MDGGSNADEPREEQVAREARAGEASQAETGHGAASSLPPAALDLAARLFDLARAGDTDGLGTYLAAGIPVNLTNHAGDTLLMLAAYHGHVATVRLLLGRGADPNVLNQRGQSPVAGAVFKGYRDVVQDLVAAGADADLGQPSARSAAAMFRRDDLLSLLGTARDHDDAGGAAAA